MLVHGWLPALLLVLAVVFAYQSVWQAGFIWDDDDYVTHNPLLTAPDGLRRIWFSTDSPSQYFPLTYTSFRIQHALWGLNPAGYHWVNILLHACNALLVWRVLARLGLPGAGLAAALFALHPVQVESVAWITELKNVQSLFFMLLATLAWLRFVEGRNSWGAYAAALGFYGLALFSKTTACTLPAALLLVLWWKQRPITWVRIGQIVPFLGLGLAMGLLTIWWERTQQGTVGNDFGLGPLERVLIATRAAWFYLGKLLWPAELTFSYPRWTIDASDPRAYLGLVAGLALMVVIGFVRRKVGRGIETAAIFFVATLSPMLGFIMLYTFRYSYVADHYQYVASIGPLALMAAGLTQLIRRWPLTTPLASRLICAALVVALGILTWRQGRMYQNLEMLWQTTIARNPSSYIAHNNLSVIMLEKGRVSEAQRHAETALSFQPEGPDLALALVNRGNALLKQDRFEEALALFRQATEVQPNYANAYNNLGSALLQYDRGEEGAPYFLKALALEPDHANAHYNLGLVLLNRGDIDEAIVRFERSLALQPDGADAHNDLGTALSFKDRLDEARQHFERALALRPAFAQAHNNLAYISLRQKRPQAAIEHYRQALSLQPENARTLAHLAWVLSTWPDATWRNGAEALRLAQRAETLVSDDPLILRSLAAAYAETGRGDEAVATLRRALGNSGIQANPALAALLGAQLEQHRAGIPIRDAGP